MIEILVLGFFGGLVGAAVARWTLDAIERYRYRQALRRRLDELDLEDTVARRLW